jgi:hypothetical protein
VTWTHLDCFSGIGWRLRVGGSVDQQSGIVRMSIVPLVAYELLQMLLEVDDMEKGGE